MQRQSHIRRAARQELRSLLVHAERTGEDIRALITVPAALRERLENFCAVADPELSDEIRQSLDLRDYM